MIRNAYRISLDFPPFLCYLVRVVNLRNQMKLSEQLKKQLEQVETSLNICQEILNKKTEEEETEEWLKNWSRWVD
jgi:hypothetical protein